MMRFCFCPRFRSSRAISSRGALKKPEVAAKINGALDGFLKETGAVILKLNPDFRSVARDCRPAPKKGAFTPDDLPDGWRNRSGAAFVREGVLNVQTKGEGSSLGVGASLPAGAARLTFRVRAPQAGEGKVTLLGAAGATETLSVTNKVTGESTWETVTVELPVKEKSGILRLYLRAGSAAVELDHLLLPPISKRAATLDLLSSKPTRAPHCTPGRSAFHATGYRSNRRPHLKQRPRTRMTRPELQRSRHPLPSGMRG
jgi:hypothetical protein